MDVAGLSDDPATRSVAGHSSSSARDRRARRPHSSGVRPGPPTGPAADVELSAAAAETADQLQADYFLRMLVQNRRHTEHRIGEYHKAIAAAEAAGDTDGAASLRRMAHLEQQDRETLDRLIENLRRRFPPRASAPRRFSLSR
jgi:hypothetical protein